MMRYETRPLLNDSGSTWDGIPRQDGKDFFISLVFLSLFWKIVRESPDDLYDIPGTP